MLNISPVLAAEDLMSHVLPHEIIEKPLFTVFGHPVYFYNHMMMALLAAVLVLVVFAYVATRVRVRPGAESAEAYVTRGRVAQFFEVLLVYIRDQVARPALGPLTDKYIKFIWSTFFFILFCNLLGMVPFGYIGRLVTGNEHLAHWQGTATGNIAVTAGLALVAFFMIHFVGIREVGIRYFAHFNPGPWYMAPLLVPLEIMGSFVKPFALCVRLFANMVAGHLVLAALLGLIFTAGEAGKLIGYGVAVPSVLGSCLLSLLELFVAFLQAYIFTFLTVLFIAAGAVHHHDEHHDVEHTEAAPPAAA